MFKVKKNKKKSISKKAIQYIKASRIDGWYIAIIFFILGEWYAISDFPTFITLTGLLGLIGIFSTVFWINYVYDKEIDIKAGKDLSFFNYISTKEMIITSFVVFIICSVILLVFVNFLSFLIGLSLFIVGIFYSVPPIRLKIRPPWDIITNGVGEALAFLLGWSVTGLALNFISIIGAIIIGLAVASHYLFYTSFDIETDKECKVRTSCTILGFSKSMSMGIIIFFSALLLSVIYLNFSVITIAFLISIPMILALKIAKNQNVILFLVGGIFLFWAGSISVILTIYSFSIITFFIAFVSLFFLVYLLLSIWFYSKENVSKT